MKSLLVPMWGGQSSWIEENMAKTKWWSKQELIIHSHRVTSNCTIGMEGLFLELLSLLLPYTASPSPRHPDFGK